MPTPLTLEVIPLFFGRRLALVNNDNSARLLEAFPNRVDGQHVYMSWRETYYESFREGGYTRFLYHEWYLWDDMPPMFADSNNSWLTHVRRLDSLN